MARPQIPPDLALLWDVEGKDPSIIEKMIRHGVGVTQAGRYRHWHRLRFYPPPDGMTSEQWWLAIKVARTPLQRQLPFVDATGRPFVYLMPDEALELLHYVDQHASGEIAMPEIVLGDDAARRRYLVDSLIEEAIRSSQLEGAVTTHRVAKEMIRSGRKPRDRSEQMILNNYLALQFIREETDETLTPAMIIELQRILTDGTLDNPDASGRVQTPYEDRVVVEDTRTGDIVHFPPPAEQLNERLRITCDFANGLIGGTGFVHPVVRAILIHFILAYDHPFEDGNGRTARALFYWSMVKQGYWITEYLSISRILREAPARYGRSFQYTETDDLDTTYFILFQLDVLKRAIIEFQEYVHRKVQEVQQVEKAIRNSEEYNRRQLDLIGNAVRHPDQRYTFRSHALSHNVSAQSARNDLLALVQKGLLERRKIGRQLYFVPIAGLSERIGSDSNPQKLRRRPST